ncbi:MAG: hypothetical protein CL678_09875 [Bdellovibrionaceae bacterium]|nr:hypothetical protein [Pseudobdellovibrionaceae bacterium]
MNDGMEITRSILKERRTLAEKGIVFVSIDFHPESFRFISEPEIVTFGLVKEDIDQFMVDELHHRLKEWVEDYSLLFDSGKAREDFDEFLRIHVRRFYFKQLNKKPIVKIIHS